jgi:hypothetical protein
MFHIHLYPESRLLFQILFSLATGPVTFAIMAWRNSLVFHSLDRLTTVAVHAFPPLVIYIMRWCATLRRMFPAHAAPLRSCLDDRAASFSHPQLSRTNRFPAKATGGDLDPGDSISWTRAVVLPLLVYVYWQICYCQYHLQNPLRFSTSRTGRILRLNVTLKTSSNPRRSEDASRGQVPPAARQKCLVSAPVHAQSLGQPRAGSLAASQGSQLSVMRVFTDRERGCNEQSDTHACAVRSSGPLQDGSLPKGAR